jgi:hypothetical protein
MWEYIYSPVCMYTVLEKYCMMVSTFPLHTSKRRGKLCTPKNLPHKSIHVNATFLHDYWVQQMYEEGHTYPSPIELFRAVMSTSSRDLLLQQTVHVEVDELMRL